MSRTEVAGAPKIPNLQSMVIGPIKPPGLSGAVKMESSGPPVELAPEVNRSERLALSTMRGTAVTGHNSDLDVSAKRYRVVKAGSYKAKDSPMKYEFKEGKIIDDANYDVRAVRAQGVRLVEVDEFDEPIVTAPTSKLYVSPAEKK